MAELGIAPHIIEAVLNHASGHKAGVAGIYNRATYEHSVFLLFGFSSIAAIHWTSTVVSIRRVARLLWFSHPHDSLTAVNVLTHASSNAGSGQ